MRNLFVASLLVSAALLNAQQVTKGQSDVYVAHNDSATAATSADLSSAPHVRKISTGVIGPKLLSESTLHVAVADFASQNPTAKQAIVSFKVDEAGVPQNVRLVKSVNQTVDSRVLAAVSQYRYVPAKLDEQAIPMDVNLVINFQ